MKLNNLKRNTPNKANATYVRFTPEQSEALKQLSAEYQLPKSTLIRSAVARFITANDL